MRRAASHSLTAYVLAAACVGLFALPAALASRGHAIAGHRQRENIADIAQITAQDVRQTRRPSPPLARLFSLAFARAPSRPLASACAASLSRA